MFWKTMFAGAEWGAAGITCCGRKFGCECCDMLLAPCSVDGNIIGGTKLGLGCGGSSVDCAKVYVRSSKAPIGGTAYLE